MPGTRTCPLQMGQYGLFFMMAFHPNVHVAVLRPRAQLPKQKQFTLSSLLVAVRYTCVPIHVKACSCGGPYLQNQESDMMSDYLCLLITDTTIVF